MKDETPAVLYELKCDYCGRIIKSNKSISVACTACGHARLHVRRPKNFCATCSSPIYDNVSPPPVRVTCGNCVQHRQSYFSAQSASLGRAIKAARKKNGWSQRTFALAMECSKSLVDMVEKGDRKPNPKMGKFMLSVSGTIQTNYGERLK